MKSGSSGLVMPCGGVEVFNVSPQKQTFAESYLYFLLRVGRGGKGGEQCLLPFKTHLNNNFVAICLLRWQPCCIRIIRLMFEKFHKSSGSVADFGNCNNCVNLSQPNTYHKLLLDNLSNLILKQLLKFIESSRKTLQ